MVQLLSFVAFVLAVGVLVFALRLRARAKVKAGATRVENSLIFVSLAAARICCWT